MPALLLSQVSLNRLSAPADHRVFPGTRCHVFSYRHNPFQPTYFRVVCIVLLSATLIFCVLQGDMMMGKTTNFLIVAVKNLRTSTLLMYFDLVKFLLIKRIAIWELRILLWIFSSQASPVTISESYQNLAFPFSLFLR